MSAEAMADRRGARISECVGHLKRMWNVEADCLQAGQSGTRGGGLKGQRYRSVTTLEAFREKVAATVVQGVCS